MKLKLSLVLVAGLILFPFGASGSQPTSLDFEYSPKNPSVGEPVTFNASSPFEKKIGAGFSCQETRDGGYIITGCRGSYNNGDLDAWLIKTDSGGKMEWERTFGLPGYEDWGKLVLETKDGGYIVSGLSDSHGPAGDYVWLLRTDSAGNERWIRKFTGFDSYPSNLDEILRGHSIQETRDSGYIIAGSTRTPAKANVSASGHEVRLMKVDSTGDEMWNKTLSVPGSTSAGATSLRQLKDGGYIIAGFQKARGALSILLMKTDAEGRMDWHKTFGGLPDSYVGRFVWQTDDGGYIIAGGASSQSGAGSDDVWLMRTDQYGDMGWVKVFHGPGKDAVLSAQETRDNGSILIVMNVSSCNLFEGDGWLMKTGSDGNEEWRRSFWGLREGLGFFARETRDGGYLVVGAKALAGSKGPVSPDLWLMKTDRAGREKWNRTFSGSSARYEWDFGDGKKGAGERAIHSYSSRGRYNVTLTLTRDEKKSDTIKKSMSVRRSGGGPDLVVSEAEAFGVQVPQPVYILKHRINVVRVTVNFTVKNVGDEPVAEEFLTEVYAGNDAKRVKTSRLGAGESFRGSVTLLCPALGTHAAPFAMPAGVKVDADNVISEVNEENNEKVADAAVMLGPS